MQSHCALLARRTGARAFLRAVLLEDADYNAGTHPNDSAVALGSTVASLAERDTDALPADGSDAATVVLRIAVAPQPALAWRPAWGRGRRRLRFASWRGIRCWR